MGGDATLARVIQQRLERIYGLESAPPVDDFAARGEDGEREVVLVREGDDGVEIAVVLPPAGLEPPAGALALDVVCQIVEGVSHFLTSPSGFRTGQPTTQLELELQAEVDKFVVLASSALARRDDRATRAIHARLYEEVRYVHGAGTEEGERYRVANDLAARFCARALVAAGARRAAPLLRRFHRAGQSEKIRLAKAA